MRKYREVLIEPKNRKPLRLQTFSICTTGDSQLSKLQIEDFIETRNFFQALSD